MTGLEYLLFKYNDLSFTIDRLVYTLLRGEAVSWNHVIPAGRHGSSIAETLPSSGLQQEEQKYRAEHQKYFIKYCRVVLITN